VFKDGSALASTVKPRAYGAPRMRLQGLTASPRQAKARHAVNAEEEPLGGADRSHPPSGRTDQAGYFPLDAHWPITEDPTALSPAANPRRS
jgi:hypothetical protein